MKGKVSDGNRTYHQSQKVRKLAILGSVIYLMSINCTTVFAGWEQTGATWKYNSNGTYFNNGWHWIDGNHDNIAECYYFNADGTMLASTTTPDNFTVNEQGAWTVNGVVQTKVKETQPAPQATEAYVEPAPQPQQNNTNTSSGEIDTSGFDFGGTNVTVESEVGDQRLPQEQYDAINDIEFN